MRILICTNAYPPRFVGGAELVAHELALEMARLGHEIQAFVGDLRGRGDHHASSTETLDAIAVHRVAMHDRDYDPARQNLVHPRIDAHLSRVLEDFRPDILHAHNLMGLSVRAPILAREHGARVVMTLHDYWGFCLRNTLILDSGATCRDRSRCRECLPLSDAPGAINLPMQVRKDLVSLALDQVDAFVAPSRFLADLYIEAGVPRRKVSVIPNGVDGDRFAERAAEPPSGRPNVQLLFVGYLGLHKGVETLLSALALMRQHATVRLSLVGEGPGEGALRRQVADLGLENWVKFVGRVAPSEMPSTYHSADIVVLPSIWNENQPVCLMEAMACGLPTVASRIGGIPEIVEHQVTGLLVEPGNAVALAEALDELVASRELRGRLGREGRRRAAKRSYLQQAEAVLALFRAVSEAPPHPTCSLPIAGLLGDDRQLFEAADKGRLEDGEDRSVRIIPVSWLTKRQTERLTRLYITKGNTRIRRFLAPIFSRMLSVLLMCLSARQRARLIVRLKQSRAISTGPGIL